MWCYHCPRNLFYFYSLWSKAAFASLDEQGGVLSNSINMVAYTNGIWSWRSELNTQVPLGKRIYSPLSPPPAQPQGNL